MPSLGSQTPCVAWWDFPKSHFASRPGITVFGIDPLVVEALKSAQVPPVDP